MAIEGPMADEMDLERYLEVTDDVPYALRVHRPPYRCPVHHRALRTSIGWVSRMEMFPSGRFMDDAAENPYCLGPETGLGDPPMSADRGRVVYCPACVAGMAARGWRSGRDTS